MHGREWIQDSFEGEQPTGVMKARRTPAVRVTIESFRKRMEERVNNPETGDLNWLFAYRVLGMIGK